MLTERASIMNMTPSKEDYIKAIYDLNGAHEKVSNKYIAEELAVSAASVTMMNSELVKEDLITNYPYKGVQLTDKGIKIAHQLVRKHRILEVFLYEKLGYQWDEVHDEADQLEHASSDYLIERLDEFLGHPQYDPHGGIIPNADGSIDEEKIPVVPLNEVKEDAFFIVKEVDDDDTLLNYLYDKGIILNAKYKLISKDAYDGTISIKSAELKEAFTISGQALEKINVIELKTNID